MIEWSKTNQDHVFLYEADDLSSCIWFKGSSCCWDVSGPGGRWTKGAGTVPIESDPEAALMQAKRFARTFIVGYRQGRLDARLVPLRPPNW